MVTTSRVTKLFALASVSALTGLGAVTGAAGCTTETVDTTQAQDAGTTDAKAATDEGTEEPFCYKEDPVDATALPYKKARVQPGKCTKNVTKVLDALLESNPTASFEQLEDALVKQESRGCADCVFFGSDGDSWGPLIMDGDQVTNINRGGCIEVVSGSETCGKAFQQWDGCLTSVCQDCTNADDVSLCSRVAENTACSDALGALIKACGKDPNSYITACFKSGQPDIYGPILELCVGSGTGSDTRSD